MDGFSEQTDAARAELRDWLQSHPPNTPDELAVHLLRAARLAAIGEPDRLLAWPGLATEAGLDAMASIREMAGAGQSVLDGVEEGDLAQAIIDAEDAGCLRIQEPRHTGLLSGIEEVLACWADSAERAIPDESVVERLESHALIWPLPDDCRLAIVAEPISGLDLELAAGLPADPPIRISKHGAALIKEEELALLDDGRPSRRLMDRFAAKRGGHELGSIGQITARGELDEWWGVRLLLEGAVSAHVHSVRLGSMPLRRDPEDPELWSVRLHPLSLASRLRMIAMDFCIRLNDGTRLIL